MSDTVCSISEALTRLHCCDPTLKRINLHYKHCTDAQLADLVTCLLEYPDIVTGLYLGSNQLTDISGVNLARYVAVSSSITVLELHNNQFGEETYLAMANALRVNISLTDLCLAGNLLFRYRRFIDAAFVNALILNPNRPAQSDWSLYYIEYKDGRTDSDFERLKNMAGRLGHLSMQALLTL